VSWNNFFMATAGASAALVGLLFVAIQLHLDTLSAEPLGRWRALARSTFDTFTLIFTFSLLMLFPIGNGTTVLVTLAVIGVGVVRLLGAWIPFWRSIFQEGRDLNMELVWQQVIPLLIYLALGFQVAKTWQMGGSPEIQEAIGYCIVILFAIVLRNSWRLLVEAAGEKKRPSRKSGHDQKA
jgi:hypothetical protein